MKWYMKAAKKGEEMILMKITHRHFKGEDEVAISFEELFQLYRENYKKPPHYRLGFQKTTTIRNFFKKPPLYGNK